MRIPQNKILSNQTTSGGEYMFKDTQQEYQGQYYVIGNQYFTGANFSTDQKELVKISTQTINVLKAQAPTFSFGQVNNNKSLISLLNTVKPLNTGFKIISNDVSQGFVIRYFCKQLNISPILIKEIDENTYNYLKNNSLYQVVSLNYYLLTHDTTSGNFKPDDLDKANSKMSGLLAFLSP